MLLRNLRKIYATVEIHLKGQKDPQRFTKGTFERTPVSLKRFLDTKLQQHSYFTAQQKFKEVDQSL